jgi:hypothetical protein
MKEVKEGSSFFLVSRTLLGTKALRVRKLRPHDEETTMKTIATVSGSVYNRARARRGKGRRPLGLRPGVPNRARFFCGHLRARFAPVAANGGPAAA